MFFIVSANDAAAQTISLQDFEAQVNQRAGTLSGYQSYLTDPDPQRAMAALQIMLESGDSTLVQMALSVGIYSADPNIRQAALKAFLAGKPALDIFFDGSETVKEDQVEAYNALMRGYRGSVGANNRASLSLKVGEWSEESGCFVNLDAPEHCLLRVNATTVSLYLVSWDGNTPHQWVVLELDDDGALTGTMTARHYRTDLGPLVLTMRLSE
ncbi:hypothetical protein [Tropicibacter oceani]|uniref:HEAT repeat domain-containing protein n=1 Tax=Tropicibacter oceani TaxID=3058420 RepID=A0ABY8QMT7_9RHOB|nr:hypothetical protein [Tropicibacter oceani]WGW05331.1 hypothetical protein QF118_07225 [Tropicibacter oceani]